MEQIPVTAVKGVGAERARALKRLGIHTAQSLLYYFPRSYEDRTLIRRIAELSDGESATVKAEVVGKVRERRYGRARAVYTATLRDESGIMTASWFNQRYMLNALKEGETYLFFGKVQRLKNAKAMQNPVFEPMEKAGRLTGSIVPVYRLTEGLSQKVMFSLLENAFALFKEPFSEYLPGWLLEKEGLCSIDFALRNIHFPEKPEDFREARKRLVFEEFLMLQLALKGVRNNRQKVRGIPMREEKLSDFMKCLPFAFTRAQSRALNEILEDMKKEAPMRRLLQGDVGSGKTIVALGAMVHAIRNGYQSAMMAPTEILAAQHAESFAPYSEALGIKMALLTGSVGKKEKDEILKGLLEGEIDLVVGTHALIEDKVRFSHLGLVVTDEQHRFGVRQREALAGKGASPHILVMSATPIPRTLASLLYGDLDLSVIDELPPGRKPVATFAVTENYRKRVYAMVKKTAEEGRQVYVVCPMIEESEVMDTSAVKALYEALTDGALHGVPMGILHGKMKASEKNEVMQRFLRREIMVLVSTTVIEVGVNVPNATVMVIENAERFGLSQLHQLRGRVGRGSDKSTCVLFYQSTSEVTLARMKTMAETNDGFKIAEKDLELRGPGDFFGTRQHGLPEMKIANIFEDMGALTRAQTAAERILSEDPLLEKEAHRGLRQKAEEGFSFIVTAG